jgi:hypothetical protein
MTFMVAKVQSNRLAFWTAESGADGIFCGKRGLIERMCGVDAGADRECV